MHTRHGLAAVIAAALGFAAAGCGGGSTASAPSTTEPPVVDAPAPEPEPLASLRIRHPDTLAFAAPFAIVADAGELSDVAREVDVATWASPDELRALLVNGDAEVAAVPSYVAANLHNRGVDVRVVAVVGWGLLHLIGPDGAAGGWDALRGETVHVPFQGDMPDLVFGFLAEANGLEPGVDLTVDYHAQPFEIVALMAAGRAEWAVLPEHAATLALAQARKAGMSVGRAMDLQDEWGTATGTRPRIPQVAVVMPGTLVDERPDVVAAVQRELEAAVAKAVEPSAALVATLAESSGLPAEVVADVLGRLNLEFAGGAEAREELERFYGALVERSPDIVGGELPGDRFYVARSG